MKLSELADYFEKLDDLSSRNAMIDVLADMFKASANPEEVREIAYLSVGTLLPSFESAEIGISEQLMARSIAEALDMDVDDVKALYRDIGDYGLVAEKLITWEGSGLTVSEAYSRLLDLARISGKGSIENKVTGLADLIRSMAPKEARYILRIPIGKLRLGIGDPTIMDGLSLAYQGDRKLRPVLENAYNLCGDIGLVARILCSEGPDRLRKFEPRIGKPIMVELAERTETLEGIIKRLGTCSVEPKYDGFRCQVHKDGDCVMIFTRNMDNATDMFPEVVSAALRQVTAQRAIFEGEAVSYDPETGEFRPFQITVQRKRKHLVEVKEEELPLRLMVFDCLYKDGEEVLYQPYSKRRQTLIDMVVPDHTIQVTDALVTDDPAKVIEMFEAMIAAGLEGIMAKNLDSPYRAGRRTFDWIKFKRSYQGVMRDTVDCAIVGYFAGRGRRAKWGIGSLLCAVYNAQTDKFETITRVASGLSDQGWQDMKQTLDAIRIDDKPARVESVYKPNVWVEPTYVTEVLADEITRSPSHTAGRDGSKTGYALRFPRIVTPIQADRKPEDSTTVEEIKRLHGIQHKL
ncbi:MAG: ATP-dependent DNA ligase [Armatimonadota bacterium]